MMPHFDIFEKKNHQIFKPRQRCGSALTATRSEAAREEKGEKLRSPPSEPAMNSIRTGELARR
jgi:hypothetical protein